MCDLHNHITTLQSLQYGEQIYSDMFRVYRDLVLSQIDFDWMKTTPGGLLAFNNVLSTTINYEVALTFARRTIHRSHLVSVLFVVKIDPINI